MGYTKKLYVMILYVSLIIWELNINAQTQPSQQPYQSQPYTTQNTKFSSPSPSVQQNTPSRSSQIPQNTTTDEFKGYGTVSIVSYPDAMVYIDGKRIKMTPLVRYRLKAGEHRLTLLRLGPPQTLRADFRLFILPNKETVTSINLPMFASLPPGTPTPIIAPPGYVPPDLRPKPKVQKTQPQSKKEKKEKKKQPEVNTGLTREQVKQLMELQRPLIKKCAGNAEGLLIVRLTIKPDGSFDNIKVKGAFEGTKIAKCVENALKDAIFDEFEGKPFTVEYHYRLRK